MFRLLVCLFLLIFSVGVKAQSTFDKLNKNPFKQTQWYVGLRGGANYTIVSPINRFGIIKPTDNANQELYEKKYQTVENIGAIYGLTAMFQFEQKFVVGTNFSVGQIRFSYDQELPGEANSITFSHQQNFQYLDVPIFFRYMIRPTINRFWNRSSRKPEVPGIIPFVQAGINFSVLLDAEKTVTQNIRQGEIEAEGFSFTENVNELLNPVTAGIFVGGGFRFRLGNVYLTTEANFRQGFSNVTDTDRRFANKNLVNNAYDVFDDKSFQTFEFVVGILVPIKYLSRREFIPVEI
ncbi:hypothetical protein C9994_05330 [Marivirga lumbricoides]|uniref:Outer membrane protein beta-barrel domain-containing protein n=1 Tax=Marivirga lumbricoides TaxID=1046115 RepID=A0A2T4DST6_9BACT|nr:hypothetical protein C9994_05330 [Marivirga lumbricoides]